MPAYLLLTEREFSTYSSQSHWPRRLLFPCSLACSCRVASHCKVQGAVASSIRSAAWAPEGGHARSARRGGRPTCTRDVPACSVASFERNSGHPSAVYMCSSLVALCSPAISSATSKGSEISRLEATVTSFLMMKS